MQPLRRCLLPFCVAQSLAWHLLFTAQHHKNAPMEPTLHRRVCDFTKRLDKMGLVIYPCLQVSEQRTEGVHPRSNRYREEVFLTNHLANEDFGKGANSAFGEYVRQRREAIGKTLRGLAGEIGISPAYLSDIEKGNRSAPQNYLEKFTSALQLVSPEDIHQFYDLAGVSKSGQHADINNYMSNLPNARIAMRTARDQNFTDDDWLSVIDYINKFKHQ